MKITKSAMCMKDNVPFSLGAIRIKPYFKSGRINIEHTDGDQAVFWINDRQFNSKDVKIECIEINTLPKFSVSSWGMEIVCHTNIVYIQVGDMLAYF